MTAIARIDAYLEALESEHASGLATEHTYRPALKALVEGATGARATNEPKRSACGAPDFSVWLDNGSDQTTIGYMEAKDLGAPLKDIAGTEQIRRYLGALDSLILTNYLEFRWYVDGELRATALLGEPGSRGRIRKRPGGPADLVGLLADFTGRAPVQVATPRELAERMARLTWLIREVIVASFTQDVATSKVRDLRVAFEEVLIPHLTMQEFADMFAQTIAYGLFAARVNQDPGRRFERRSAPYEIPRTNPFLRRLFEAITGPELDDEPYAGLVDDLAQLLGTADMASVLASFGGRSGRDDPVVHFYETFLTAYDPAMREMRGVYYTPEPVVSYIVDSVDSVLRTHFGCEDGLAQPAELDLGNGSSAAAGTRVLVLDPACGTGTFLYSIVDRIREQFRERNEAGSWPAYVREDLIPRLFGFELLIAPYAIAHLKLGMQLAGHDLPSSERGDWTYDLAGAERLGIYLTNTLEEAVKKSELLLGAFIAEEANAAADVKRELPILVVVGNPPYSGHSANKGPWIKELVADYAKARPGVPKPRQGKWLQDDYIKFIRFGQWRIDRTGAGVLAFVTNHSYLESSTFAGMRASLAETFSDIYLLDLHGNSKKGECAPDGGVDQNVFDIQQGVAIGIFVKEPGKAGSATVHHADLFGDRASKYEWLAENDVGTTKWADVRPSAPEHLFIPQDEDLQDEYDRGWSVADVMALNGKPAMGIVTTHDQFAISKSPEETRSKIRRFVETSSEEEARRLWRLCGQAQWNYGRAKRALGGGDWEDDLQAIQYRPFDQRWTVFDPNVAVHLRQRVSAHLRRGPNVALITSRMTKGESFAHAHVSRMPAEAICLSPKTSNNAFVFPLYLYPEGTGTQRRLLIEGEPTGRRANLAPAFVAEISSRVGLAFTADGRGDLGATFGPEDLFHYIYAVLHAPGYRGRYESLLRRDFPRIPLPTDRNLFVALAEQGEALVELHLLEAKPYAAFPAFPVRGSNLVEPGHPKYLAPGESDPLSGMPLSTGRVYISKKHRKDQTRGQYFDNVSAEAWEFRVGGYRVCEKWLKDRRGDALTLDDLRRYQRIVAVAEQTSGVVAAIDRVAPTWPLPAPARRSDQVRPASNPLA